MCPAPVPCSSFLPVQFSLQSSTAWICTGTWTSPSIQSTHILIGVVHLKKECRYMMNKISFLQKTEFWIRQTFILLLYLGKIWDYASVGRERGFLQRKRGVETIQDGVSTADGTKPKYSKVSKICWKNKLVSFPYTKVTGCLSDFLYI